MSRPKHSERHPIDVHVGARIRLRRNQLRLSQNELASKVGLSFQSVQKYEAGHNRISASRLFEIAQALQVSPGYFFNSYPYEPATAPLDDDIALDATTDGTRLRQIVSLIQGYFAIRDPELQADVMRFVSKLGAHNDRR
jgi:transcriptional regulator with XRE-family HTH domain